MSPTSTQALLLSNEHHWLCTTYTGSVNFDCQYLRVQNRPFTGSWVFPGSRRTWDVLVNSTSCSHCTSSLRTVTTASVSSLKRVVRLFTPIFANSSSYNRSHGGSVCLPFAETDWKCPFLLQSLKIVSLAGQDFMSWLWRPRQKQGRSFKEGSLMNPSFRLRAGWLFVGCSLLRERACLTNVINCVSSF